MTGGFPNTAAVGDALMPGTCDGRLVFFPPTWVQEVPSKDAQRRFPPPL